MNEQKIVAVEVGESILRFVSEKAAELGPMVPAIATAAFTGDLGGAAHLLRMAADELEGQHGFDGQRYNRLIEAVAMLSEAAAVQVAEREAGVPVVGASLSGAFLVGALKAVRAAMPVTMH